MALEWISLGKGIPPILLEELLDGSDLDSVLMAQIRSLLERKLADTELGVGPRIPILHDYLEEAVSQMDDRIAAARLLPVNDSSSEEELDEFLRRTVSAEYAMMR